MQWQMSLSIMHNDARDSLGTGGKHVIQSGNWRGARDVVIQSGNWRVARNTVWKLEGCT